MSRVFDATDGKYLAAASTATSTQNAEFTQVAWIKPTESGSVWAYRVFFGFNETNRKWFESRDSDTRIFATGATTTTVWSGSVLPQNGWIMVGYRRKSNGAGAHEYQIYINGTWSAAVLDSSAVGLDSAASVWLGTTPNTGFQPAKGKIAHSAQFLRALSDAEFASLQSGSNPDELDPTGRFAYFPMVDSNLDNYWGGDVGSLVMTGAVANDDADNPTVNAVILPATVSLAANPQLDATLSFTYSNYAGIPVGPLAFDQGARSLPDEAVTITDNGDGSGSGVTDTALPGLPANGESVTPFPLIGTDIDITLPDPGA